jgi:ParB-like chromosome segregation protein Spo0J
LRLIFPNLENKVYLPVNIPRLIKNVKAKHQVELRMTETLTYSPLEVIEKVEEMIQRVINDKGSDELAI